MVPTSGLWHLVTFATESGNRLDLMPISRVVSDALQMLEKLFVY